MLLVIDMQNDFVTGVLGSNQASDIVSCVVDKVQEYRMLGYPIVYSRDTHTDNYMSTQEGKYLPIVHCVLGTNGHDIIPQLDTQGAVVIDKYTFGCIQLADKVAELVQIHNCSTIEVCGVCTDICVVSNALILKAKLPDIKIVVDSKACAGTTLSNHQAALVVLSSNQVQVL